MSELNFTDETIERHEHIRLDASALDKLMRSAESRFLVIQTGRVKTVPGEQLTMAWLPWAEVQDETEKGAEIIFLGEYRNVHRFAMIPAEAPQTIETRPREVKPDGDFVGVFHVATALSPAEGQLVVMSAHFANWINRTRRCGRCGSPMAARDGGHRRECTNDACKWQEFPRTDPVVLSLVTKGDRCILGRQPRFPKGFYSPLAGFVSPAETIEAAVRREVGEEVGVKVGKVTYLASQPWPFPGSLMMGFVSEAISDDLTVDKSELEDAQWFTRAEVQAIARGEEVRGMKLHLPPKGVVARFVIEHWLANGAG
ncbi:MAG TPA: NAD(+) diphosphatase [Hyphomonadaceae bacterium]|jgi:NAD+ diphosphatase|nr:NAD(+) diphosphatase [Hyphomonadaceae bacterium]